MITLPLHAQDTLLTVDFESSGFGYTLTNGFYAGTDDYWARTYGSDILTNAPYTGQQGTWFVAGEDLDASGQTFFAVTTDAVAMSGYSDLQVSLFLAAAGTPDRYEPDDFISIQYSVDGGGYSQIGRFSGSSLDWYGSDMYQDVDFNGYGDTFAARLTNAFSEHTFSIPETGSSLRVRVVAMSNANHEEIALDNIRIAGTPPAEPEINVRHDQNNIGNNTTYHVDTVKLGESSDNVFTIENTGDASLTLATPLSLSGNFSIVVQPASAVPAQGSTSFTVRFTAGSTPGVKTSTLTIGNNDSDENPFKIYLEATAQENQAPVLTAIGNKLVYEPDELNFSVSASDSDEDALTLSASNLPTGADFTDHGDGTGTFSWFTEFDDAGEYAAVRFEVTDGEDTDFEEIAISVKDSPIANAIDFEIADDGYSAVNPFWLNADEHWNRSDGQNISPDAPYLRAQGTWFFAGENMDYLGVVEREVISDEITVTGLQSLKVSLLLAASGSSYLQADEISIQYSLDASEFIEIGHVCGSGSALLEDTDLDGIPDGRALTNTFSYFTFDIPGSGSSLRVKVAALCDHDQEDLAIDHIAITSTSIIFLDGFESGNTTWWISAGAPQTRCNGAAEILRAYCSMDSNREGESLGF